MACEAVFTGQRFVAQMLTHIDCQAQAIGAYGYGALASPGSPVSIALTGLLTIFVAIFGLRLLSGEPIGGRDLLGDVLRLGIVLTLATSWPAWRTLGYDLVMRGPGEVAASLQGASASPVNQSALIGRLQAADDGIVLLTVFGTGRNTGGTNRSNTIGDSFRGTALADQEGLANGRIAFLAGVIGPLGIVRLGAGLLLALAPLMAGLLLFAGTRDLFLGWLRALGALAVGALALTMALVVELSILEPWLRDALAQRDAQILTPSAPTELFVITLAFALVSFGLLALIARIFFFGGLSLPRLSTYLQPGNSSQPLVPQARAMAAQAGEPMSRAFQVADAVAQTLRREERTSQLSRVLQQSRPTREAATSGRTSSESATNQVLGSSYRQDARRFSRSSSARDKRDSKT